MAWHYLHDTATGRLLSESSEPITPGAGQAVVTRADRPEGEMWDAATRAFVARPPKVLVDRLTDLDNDPVLAAIWTRLTVAQRPVLRNRLIALLGSKRFRHPSESTNLR